MRFRLRLSTIETNIYILFILFSGLLCAFSGCTVNTTASLHKNKATPVSKPSSRYLISKDAAPRGPLPTHFKTVTPINEPLSHYGNPDSYIVDGVRYQVLRTANGYKARGLASWYGVKFHSQRTSSGELYDMYAMTAAHKTLPIPCYVKVKNLQNGREILVKVNDRGPFHVNRLIDLSYAAATKLGILPNGTALVEIRGIMPSGQKYPHVANYYVQLAVFSEKQRAQLLQKNAKKWVKAPIFIENYREKHIVKAGPFAQKKQADIVKQQLMTHGLQGSLMLLQ